MSVAHPSHLEGWLSIVVRPRGGIFKERWQCENPWAILRKVFMSYSLKQNLLGLTLWAAATTLAFGEPESPTHEGTGKPPPEFLDRGNEVAGSG